MAALSSLRPPQPITECLDAAIPVRLFWLVKNSCSEDIVESFSTGSASPVRRPVNYGM